MDSTSEEMVSANRRTFVVSVGPKIGGITAPIPQVLIIKAYSIAQAKRQAVKKMAVGHWKHWNKLKLWKFFSVEDANEPSKKSASEENN